MMLVESDVSDEWDSRIDWADLAERSVLAAIRASRIPGLAASEAEISVKFTSDNEVRGLNAAWRGKDKATNVLSFPMIEADRLDMQGPSMLGDIVLAFETCAAEAAGKPVRLEDHAAHLLVHGTLHLLGYDHEQDDEAAGMMEEVERQALASIGIANPYQVTEVQS